MVLGLKNIFGKKEGNDYLEVDVSSAQPSQNKVSVKPFILRSFEEVNDILNALREGYTIAVIDIKPLKTKDIIELKRAVAKVKKTVDALEGSIAGFGDNTIIATPNFAEIHKVPAQKVATKADFLN